MRIFRHFIIGLCFASGLSCAVVNPVTGKKQLFVMSEEKEIAMGTEYDPQIVASMGLYEDEVLQAYIEEKGKEMGKISHRPNLTYHFRIVDTPVINAFAVPGGYVYFTRGIMAHFNNEAEFAGVLGHEIGHITARHSVEQMRNQQLAQVGLIAGMIASPTLAEMAQPASQAMGLMLLKFGRDAESQSDELGVEYSSKIGYDAHEMADFFNTLARKQQQAGASIPEFMSTHPSPEGRREKVHEHAEDWQGQLNMSDKEVGRDSYLAMIDGIVYGEDPRQGFVENNTFYHPVLKFEFDIPTGWQYQNSPQQFQMANEDGSSMMILQLGQGTSVQEVSQNTLTQYNLTAQSQKQTTINGLNAYVVTATQAPQQDQQQQQAEQQEALQLKIATIELDGYFFNLIGATTESLFASEVARFSSTIDSFSELTNQAMLNKKPTRVRIRTVEDAGTLSQVLQGFGMPEDQHEDLSILNGMMLTDQISRGTKVKVLGE